MEYVDVKNRSGNWYIVNQTYMYGEDLQDLRNKSYYKEACILDIGYAVITRWLDIIFIWID